MSFSNVGILAGLMIGGYEEERVNEKYQELILDANNGNYNAFFKLHNIDISKRVDRDTYEHYEEPDGQREYLVELIKFKKIPVEKRDTSKKDSKFLSYISQYKLGELIYFLELGDVARKMYLKWKDDGGLERVQEKEADSSAGTIFAISIFLFGLIVIFANTSN